MSLYVHISTVFACDDAAKLSEVAKKHRQIGIKSNSDGAQSAMTFLEDAEAGSLVHDGRKGGLASWGHVGNYVMGEDFVNALLPFFEDLVRSDCGLFDFENVMVFCEREQSDFAEAWEISFDKDTGKATAKHHPSLPFKWGQS